jgi:hypothetical protein
MQKREAIVREIEKRMSEVIANVYRNPDHVPSKDDLPMISIIELNCDVDETDQRGGKPRYKRTLRLVIEVFITGTSDDLATRELMEKHAEVRRELYADPVALGLNAIVEEAGDSRVFRPESGSHIAGVGTTVLIRYVEDTSQL